MLHIAISVLTPRTATLPSADACGLPPFTPCCYAVKHPPVHSFTLFLVQTALVGASLKHSGCSRKRKASHWSRCHQCVISLQKWLPSRTYLQSCESRWSDWTDCHAALKRQQCGYTTCNSWWPIDQYDTACFPVFDLKIDQSWWKRPRHQTRVSLKELTFISRSEIRCIQEQILLLFLFLFTTFYLVIHPDVVAVTDGVILHGGYGLCM